MTIVWVCLLAVVLAAGVVWLVLGTHGLAMARWFMRKVFPEVPHVSPTQLAAWLTDAARPTPVLLDVRTPEEFAVSHLPGAVRVDEDAAAESILSMLPPGRAVVTYCAAGYRSTKMARRLRRAGVKEVYDLDGAIFAWAREGRPLEREGKVATGVHPFNAVGRKLLGEKYAAKLPPPD